jgi:tetratricopeptide (TPR) repeat protein
VAQNPRLEELRKRLEREPDSPLFAQYAEELRRAGELAEAIRVCREGLAKRPSYATVRVTLGRALADSGDSAAAREEFQAVLRTVPDNVSARRGLEELGVGPASDWAKATERASAGEPRPREGAAVAPGSAVGEGDAGDARETPAAAPRQPEGASEAEGAAGDDHGGQTGEDEEYELESLRPPAPAGPPQLTFRPLIDEETREGAAFASDVPTLPGVAPTAAVVERPEPAAPPPTPMAATAKPAGDGLASPTLAELYLQQGSAEKAVGMYEGLLARDPENAQLRKRLGELRARLAAEPGQLGPDAGGGGNAIRRAIARLEGLRAAFRRGQGGSDRASGALA